MASLPQARRATTCSIPTTSTAGSSPKAIWMRRHRRGWCGSHNPRRLSLTRRTGPAVRRTRGTILVGLTYSIAADSRRWSGDGRDGHRRKRVITHDTPHHQENKNEYHEPSNEPNVGTHAENSPSGAIAPDLRSRP